MTPLEQGDLVEVSFTPAVGHEPAKSRPAVVLSTYGFNCRSSLVVVAPVTSTNNGYPLHVPLSTGLVRGYVQVEALRCLDLERRGYELLGVVPEATMTRVMSHVRSIFDLR
ncbi:type II toxin-antitoxin system PemK/MazF family toxin [Olsenella phocaeensis]|uniref:type II toxin-antitoxin system PemK/MazF family toxin n=1 Tax=Olsenella phocaeensis TaxID=1852385 RepID=UPI003A8C9435